MTRTTIDNLDIKIHARYAQDQAQLDPKFVEEVQQLSPHSAIDGFSFIYGSEFEKLFDLQNKNKSWASFSPPDSVKAQKNRYFTHRIILSIMGDECDDKEEQKESEDHEQPQEEGEDPDLLIQKAASIEKEEFHSSRVFENEKLTIINMLGSIKHLNTMLQECNAKRLQYQKG